ncbi:hypothetical protein D3C73_829940 [compost metagenome]
MPGTPSIWNGSRMPCQWIEVSSSSVLVTDRRTFCPSRRRISGAGRVPLTVTAWPVRPPRVKSEWPTVSATSGPCSVGRLGASPGVPLRAQAGTSPCAASRPSPPAAPRSKLLRSVAVIVMRRLSREIRRVF